jgi:hypothetical protein
MLTLSPHMKKGNPSRSPQTMLATTDADLVHVLTPDVVQHCDNGIAVMTRAGSGSTWQ